MPVIDQPEPRGAQFTKTINRHIEAVLLGIGFLLGGFTAVAAGLLT